MTDKKNTVIVVLYNYKSSNLVEAVRSIYEKASSKIDIAYTVVYDQHPIIREDKLPKFDGIGYKHVFWDHQYTPINYKKEHALKSNADYFLSMSADIVMSENWDQQLISFIQNRESMIVSGHGYGTLQPEDKYFVKYSWNKESNDFTLTNYIDRNFLFGRSSTIKRIEFPVWMKYLGEEEMMSIDAFRQGIEIYSAPTSLYSDNHHRNLENLYSPFSIEHGYNSFIEYINDESLPWKDKIEEFFDFHKVDYKKLKKLHYQIDDVLYDPNTLKIVDIGGERFIDQVKVIY